MTLEFDPECIFLTLKTYQTSLLLKSYDTPVGIEGTFQTHRHTKEEG